MHRKNRYLFIVKQRSEYGVCHYDSPDYFGGLWNSASFVVQMLQDAGIEAKLVQVLDNNEIHREVRRYKPTVVVIEALWVVPEKFSILIPLNPDIRWIVRCHSELPFIALEGIAMDWIIRYLAFPQVSVGSNSAYGTRDFRAIAQLAYPTWSQAEIEARVPYLPNYYPELCVPDYHKPLGNHLDIGCFGAIRPLKNQLIQAVAALEFARIKNRPLRFHVNERCEQGGSSVFKNLRGLFAGTHQELVEHPWEGRSEFLRLVSTMTAGLQVSFSETFDITAADFVSLLVPIVTSHEITWSSPDSQASPTNAASIVARLEYVTGSNEGRVKLENLRRLRNQCEDNRRTWLNYA